uniref:Immunoglobulin subtype domain-containing protein n=1 Tax=Oryzias melastigma TaxID=30732 RepID=A0A3B3E1T1_ORYME
SSRIHPLECFSALTPVFVQTGEDVVLDVNGADCSEDSVVIVWRFNQNVNLVRLLCHNDTKPTVNRLKYQDRAEITEITSLKLKNCQKSFSGVYSVIRSFDKDEVVAEYNVTVEVSPVLLNVDSVFNSSNFCNLTVTCRTDHSHISSSFTCGSESCKQDDGQQTNVTKQENLLQVYLSDDSVICNHSNHVSWANSTEKIRLIYNADQTGHGIWVIIGGCVIALVIIAGVIFLGNKILTYFKGISVIAVHQNIFVFNKMGYILILLCLYLLFDFIY